MDQQSAERQLHAKPHGSLSEGGTLENMTGTVITWFICGTELWKPRWGHLTQAAGFKGERAGKIRQVQRKLL